MSFVYRDKVWSENNLLANITDHHPSFVVRGLPPDTDLRLRLYNVSPHAQSQPVVLFAKTKPLQLATTQGMSMMKYRFFFYLYIFFADTSIPKPSPKSSSSTDERKDEESVSDDLPFFLGMIAGGAGLLLVVAALVGVIVLKATKRYSEDAGMESELQASYTLGIWTK